MVQTIPFFKQLRHQYPKSEIHAVITKDSEFLLKDNPYIDRVITVSSSWFFPERKSVSSVIFKTIRQEKYDIGYDLRGDFRNIALMRVAGVKNIIGYGCTGGGFLLDKEFNYNRDDHEIDKNLKLIGESANREFLFDFNVSFVDRKIVDHITRGLEKPWIVIHPFSRASSKIWGIGKYNQLLQKIVQKTHGTIFIIGSKEDIKDESQFNWHSRMINCIGKTSLGTSIGLIRMASVFIGNDSGPQYFAAYSGVRTCVIYGYTVNHKRWKPKVKDDNFIDISIPVECGPCELAICNQKSGHPCMDLITVDLVINRIKPWLNE